MGSAEFDSYDEHVVSEELESIIGWELEKIQLTMQVVLIDAPWQAVNKRLEHTPAFIERRKIVQEFEDGRIVTISESRGADDRPYWVRCSYPDDGEKAEIIDYMWGPEGRPQRLIKDTIIRTDSEDSNVGQPEAIMMPGIYEADIEHIKELLSEISKEQVRSRHDYETEFQTIAKRVDMKPHLVVVAADDEQVIRAAKILDQEGEWDEYSRSFFLSVVKLAEEKYSLSEDGVMRAIALAQTNMQQENNDDQA